MGTTVMPASRAAATRSRPGIAHGRRARIRHQGDVPAVAQDLEQGFESALVRMGVVAQELRRGPEVGEQAPGAAGVLGGHHRNASGAPRLARAERSPRLPSGVATT